MGIIDRSWAKLTCDACGITETQSAVQKGSSFNFSDWGPFDAFQHFEVQVATSQPWNEPDVKSGECKKCKVPARIDSGYNSP